MRAIMTKEETQIVFLDTPGVVNEQTQKKFSLESRLMTGQREGSTFFTRVSSQIRRTRATRQTFWLFCTMCPTGESATYRDTS